MGRGRTRGRVFGTRERAGKLKEKKKRTKERGGFCLERETGEGKIVRTGGKFLNKGENGGKTGEA